MTVNNNVIEYWIKTATGSGEPLSIATEQLSVQTGTHINVSRLGEWRRGERSLPKNVQRVMLADALPSILMAHGIAALPDLADDQIWPDLADAMMPPM
jgi:hypothetical protein